MKILHDKTAIVTGASSGIGQAIVEKLANEGINVALVARRLDRLQQIANDINGQENSGKALPIQADVRNLLAMEEVCKRVINKFGAVDVYVNNAGVMKSAALTAGEVEQWNQMIDVNIKGVLYGIHSVLSHMLDRSTGHIINVASVSGFEVSKRSAVYSATKYAVRALSMGLEKELARTGVRVTNISPGMVETDLTSRSKINRKILQPEDIAKAVLFAISQPDYVNVNEITVRPV